MSIRRSPELGGLTDNRVRAALFYAKKRRLARKQGQATITGTPPALDPLSDGAALSTAVDWGSYNDSDSVFRQMRLNAGHWNPYDGTTEVEEGQLWTIREKVQLAGVVSTFTSNTVEVTE